MKIELTEDEYAWLLFLLGYATGAARQDKNEPLANQFLRLTNAIGRNSPNFVPFEVRDDKPKA